MALFTTLVTDTGWFRYSNTDVGDDAPRGGAGGAGRPAGGCLRGPLPASGSIPLARTLSAALARTSYYADGALAVIDLPLQPDGTPLDVDGDGVLDVLRAVESVEVALVLRAIEPTRCASARSKGAFDAQRPRR